jgi:glycerol-3-phosphate acyltransferase PlsX
MAQSSERVSVAVDAMGGDFAPQEIVSGAVAAAREGGVRPILVGPLDILKEELAKHDTNGLPIHCVNAETFVKEDDNPALSVRRMPNSSIAVATKLVKSGEASALIGATATGSLVTSAVQNLGMVDGFSRPVIGGVLSSSAPKTAIFDLGVNMDCRPIHLVQFAIIGTVFCRLFLGVPNPTVALLNVGMEEGKGNAVVREAYTMLKKSGLNFIGNIEGSGILTGQANVIICDAFVGNCLFKLCEGGNQMYMNLFRSKLSKYPVVGTFLKGKIKKLMTNLAQPDSVGSGILWGIDGLVMKLHGHSRADEVALKLRHAKVAVEKDTVSCVKAELNKIREHINIGKE